MKRRIAFITAICLIVSSCSSSNERSVNTSDADTASLVYEERIAVRENVEVESEVVSIEEGGITADADTVLSERRRIACLWAENALAEWLTTESGRLICSGDDPEITAISLEGKVVAVSEDKEFCFEADINNKLKFVGFHSGFINDNEKMWEVT